MPFLNAKVSNNGASTLEAGISAGIWTLILATGTRGLFPSTFPFFLTVEKFNASLQITKREIVKVTAGPTEALTITRSAGYCPANYTATTLTNTAFSFDAGDSVKLKLVGEIIDDMNTEIARLESDKADQADLDALANTYFSASGGTDEYAFSITGVVSYASIVGKKYSFVADVANTGASAININGLGAIPLYVNFDQNTTTGDIKAGQIIDFVVWSGGASAQITSQSAKVIDTSGFSSRVRSMTASGGIPAGGAVYSNGDNTVKKIYPSAMTNTGTSVATAPTNASTTRNMKLSTAWLYLHIAWWSSSVAATLNAQVRTINAGETDFTNGTAVSIYSTWNWTRAFSVCEISTDKFLIIFQADTGWSGAGTKCVVISISGTVVTVGSVSTIESTGFIAYWQGCAKVDTDKAIIFYWRDSDQDLMAQVLTVSGTSITTNTPVLVKACWNTQLQSPAVQLSTNTIAVVYQDWGTSHIFGRVITVSWTTPSIGAENTIITSPWTSSVGFSLAFISATKIFFHYSNNSPVNDTCMNIAISGATMTPSSTLALGSDRTSTHAGIMAIWSSYLLFYHKTESTTLTIRFLDVSSTTPTQISSSGVSVSTISQNLGYSIAKVSPWTYLVCGSWADTDFIVKLTPITSVFTGVAESAILDTIAGNITMRFQVATISGAVGGSRYYIDDDGTLTTKSSLTAPSAGVGIATDTILLS